MEVEKTIKQFQNLVEENPDEKLTLELEVDKGSLLTRIFKNQVPLLESFQKGSRYLLVKYQDGFLVEISLIEDQVKNVAIRSVDNKLKFLGRTIGDKEVLKMTFGENGVYDRLDKNLLPKEFHDVIVPDLIEHLDLISPRKEEKEETEKEVTTEKEATIEDKIKK